MLWRVLYWTSRLAVGALFVFAGYIKVRNSFLFEMAVDSYRLLPPSGVIVVARTLPWLEIVLGGLLLAGWKLRYTAAATALLLGGFVIAMSITYARGIEANCGCFGFTERISPFTLARDFLLFAATAFLAAYSWRQQRDSSAGSAI